jgi:hypothetical protein
VKEELRLGTLEAMDGSLAASLAVSKSSSDVNGIAAGGYDATPYCYPSREGEPPLFAPLAPCEADALKRFSCAWAWAWVCSHIDYLCDAQRL